MKPGLHRRAAGVSLVTAIFVLVVLSALGVAMVTFTSAQQAALGLDIQGSRVYQAARAGAEWGVYRVTRQSSCAGTSTMAFGTATATVACTATVDATTGQTRYVVMSTACSIPNSGSGNCPNASNSADYVQRVVQIEFNTLVAP